MNINEAFNLLNITGTVNQGEIKKAYKIASLKYHPDKNPNGKDMMIAINSAYDFLKKLGVSVSPDENFKSYDYAEELNEVLNQLSTMEGIDIEICGNWIWLSGNTKQYKTELGKDGLKCKWASKKKMWYYRPDEYKSFGRSSKTMDQIRDKFGSTKVKTKPFRTLTA